MQIETKLFSGVYGAESIYISYIRSYRVQCPPIAVFLPIHQSQSIKPWTHAPRLVVPVVEKLYIAGKAM